MDGDEIIFFAWLATWLPFAIAYFISEAKGRQQRRVKEKSEWDTNCHEMSKETKNDRNHKNKKAS